MPHRIKREPEGPGEEDTTYVYSRIEDRSFWARTSAALEKYKLLAWIIVTIIVAAGYGFKTPGQTFDLIHSQIDTLQLHERAAVAERGALVNKIDALIRLECVRAAREHIEQDAILVGLDCK